MTNAPKLECEVVSPPTFDLYLIKPGFNTSFWNMILFRSNDLSTDSFKISKEIVHVVCLLFLFVYFVPFCVLTKKCYNSTAINKNK